jgi:hypothetical protein
MHMHRFFFFLLEPCICIDGMKILDTLVFDLAVKKIQLWRPHNSKASKLMACRILGGTLIHSLYPGWTLRVHLANKNTEPGCSRIAVYVM